MVYQTLVGAWPLDLSPDDRPALEAYAARIQAWQEKALREAKRRSEWVAPNIEYENTCRDFLVQILDPERAARMVYEIADFARRIAPAGALNGLAQTLLRMTAPGVPDLYQGTEFWDFSLVDPDNRRPVDYDARRAALAAGESPPALLDSWKDGRVKQALIARALALRARMPELFIAGGYQPLRVEGRLSDHIFAFVRTHEGHVVIVVASRLAAPLLGVAGRPLVDPSAWQATAIHLPRNLAGRDYVDALGGSGIAGTAGRLQVEDVLAAFPVALLEVR
jgi:(1->4)-alpha-D-glucan 1-alpha-D-glucosylmutase